jgi:hypothetical protein
VVHVSLGTEVDAGAVEVAGVDGQPDLGLEDSDAHNLRSPYDFGGMVV